MPSIQEKGTSLEIRLFPKPPLADLSVSAPVSGPVIVAENTGRSVFTVQQVSCGPVTFIQS